MTPLAHLQLVLPGGPLDVRVGPGDLVLLEGPNGSGKSTALRALAGMPAAHPVTRLRIAGTDPHPGPTAWPNLVRFVQQDPRDGLAGLTVAGEARLRGMPAHGPRALSDGPAAAVEDDRAIATLSSGEARRVALDLCGRSRAPLVLLDEPAEGLDAAGRQALVALVASSCRTGAAVVAADHAGVLASAFPDARRIALGAAPDVALAPITPADGTHPTAAGRRLSFPGGRDTERHVRLPPVAFRPGFHALSGPNGGGKSTLLLHLAGLRTAPAAVLQDGVGVPRHPRPGVDVRLLLPHARDHFSRPTVGAEWPAAPRGPLGGRGPGGGPDAAVADWVERWGVAEVAGRHPATLSGGQAQRAALAKTFAVAAPVVLLDEPEAHLDAQGRAVLRDAIAQRVAEGCIVVAATHDPALLGLAHSVTHVAQRGGEAQA